MDTVAENAARVCGAMDSIIFRLDGDVLRLMARHRVLPSALDVGETISATRDTVSGRAVTERRTMHVEDLWALPETEFPETRARSRRRGIGYAGGRTLLATPLLREGVPVGVITIRREEVQPFSPRQIALLETFAAQAVIAIENVRLFNETKEALEQQTATSEILRVIASSPTTVDPVFDAILDSALRLCASPVGNLFLFDGEAFRLVAGRGMPGALVEAWQRPQVFGPHTGVARAVTERGPVHIADMTADPAYGERDPIRVQTVELLGARTGLFVPMLKEGTPVGVIVTWRREVQAFSESHIQLLSTFAAQAVIAIENVRLFNETTEALEQQTATGEILRVLSSSPTDIQPVFDAIVSVSPS
jgi:GAF domain-containing protein